MRCPQCRGQLLKIEVNFHGFVTAFFYNADEYQLTQPVSMTSSWEETSPCLCEACDWKGVIADALACCEAATLDADEE